MILHTHSRSQKTMFKLLEEIRNKRGVLLSKTDANHLVAHLRRHYPFESIRKRLPKRHLNFNRGGVILLGPEAQKDLEEYEALNFRAARTYGDVVRSLSLKLLHEEQVHEFVARDGNGYMRTPPPSAIHLAIEDAPYIRFGK